VRHLAGSIFHQPVYISFNLAGGSSQLVRQVSVGYFGPCFAFYILQHRRKAARI